MPRTTSRPGQVRTWAVLACAALGVSACAGGGVTPTAPTPVAVTAVPMPVAGYDWFFHTDEGEARLAFGLAESDDVPLGLSCRDGSGRLTLSATASKAGREIHLDAGGETGRFPATAEPSEIHEGVFLIADAAADAPVFRRFRQIGWLAIGQGTDRQTLVPQPGTKGEIERFFAMCG